MYSINILLGFVNLTMKNENNHSGIKLFDIEKMARIAHIDRPTGGEFSAHI